MKESSQEVYSILHVRNLEALMPSFAADAHRVQLKSGPVRGRIEIGYLGSSFLVYGDYEAPERFASGIFSKDKVTFATFEGSPKNRAHGHELSRDKLFVWPEESEHLQHYEGRLAWLAILVTYEELNQFAEVVHHREVDRFGDHCIILQPNPNSLASLRQTSREILHTMRTKPVFSQDQRDLRHKHDDLMHLLLKSLFCCDSPGKIRLEPKRIRFERKFIAARDYIRSNLGNSISIYDLCRFTGLSERSLRRNFQENLGLSPSEFIRKQRLIDARAELKRSSAASNTVTTIAHECGFVHLGRFSAYYRELFGESPRETLLRA